MEGEPYAKKSRIREETPSEEKEVHKRSITLNLTECHDWVRRLSDEELEKIFRLGVLAKESLEMNVESNQKGLEEMLESQLDSQMKPVQEKVQEIERRVTRSVDDNLLQMTNTMNRFNTNLVTEVSGVADKVKPLDSLNKTVEDSKDKILDKIASLEKSVQALRKPKTKGTMGEQLVLDILKEKLHKSFTVEDSSAIANSGDVRVTTVDGEIEFLIEVKNHDNPIAKEVIEKFEKDVKNSSKVKVGILFSLNSGIARRSKRGDFEINQDKNKYFIYVPNVLQQENLIVWSVMLANELAQMNAELKESQKKELNGLYEKFNTNIENAKNSRNHLKSLEEVMKNLKESIEPILDIVEQSKNDIYKLLH